MFFVEARYQPETAADQVRYIAHREEGLPDGQRRELYGIGPRYRAFAETNGRSAGPSSRTHEASGSPSTSVSFSPSTPGRRTASPASTAASSSACHQGLGGEDVPWRRARRPGRLRHPPARRRARPSHPHVHALLSPRLQNGSRTTLSPRAIQEVRQRWEREVLCGLERQERRISRARHERPPVDLPPRYRTYDHLRQLQLEPERARRHRRRLSPIGVFFLRTKEARGRAGLGGRWLGRLLRPGARLAAITRDPERAARRTTLRLVAALMPRGTHSLGLRTR